MLSNAPVIVQHCMVAIFCDMGEKFIEVFMDKISIFGSSFDIFFDNLALVLQCCEENNLVFNWKCHFMVQEVIFLGHHILTKRIKVDRENIKVIEKLPPPT